MGWTSQHAEYYMANGAVDKKRECDAYFMEGLNRGHFLVLKSATVGSVYYAAVKKLLKYAGLDENGNSIYVPLLEEEQTVFAAVFLTSLKREGYWNFAYKPMDETVEPCHYDCPDSILKLLSPTDNAYANEWRRKCRLKNEKKKRLKSLKEGSKILVFFRKDKEVSFVKQKYGSKNYWVKDDQRNTYIKQSDLLQYDFDILETVV